MVNVFAFGECFVPFLFQFHFLALFQDVVFRSAVGGGQRVSGNGGHAQKNSCDQFFVFVHLVMPPQCFLHDLESRDSGLSWWFVYREECIIANSYFKYDDMLQFVHGQCEIMETAIHNIDSFSFLFQ